MENDYGALQNVIAAISGGKGKKADIEAILKLMSTENGRKLLKYLMSDGGAGVKAAAERAKNGDMGGIAELISAVSKTPEGREVLSSLSKVLKDD